MELLFNPLLSVGLVLIQRYCGRQSNVFLKNNNKGYAFGSVTVQLVLKLFPKYQGDNRENL